MRSSIWVALQKPNSLWRMIPGKKILVWTNELQQEAFAIFHAITHWRDLLIREKFKVYTDHRNLTFVLNAESKKLIRWRLLQEFVFEIEHIAGEKNVEADYLSRVHC